MKLFIFYSKMQIVLQKDNANQVENRCCAVSLCSVYANRNVYA